MANTRYHYLAMIGLWLSSGLGAQNFDSGPQRVVLVELFTSQGCSSCPPADRWLSGLKTDPRLWQQVVPVAFHVDYWDRLGWKDPHARPEHSLRQRQHHGVGAIRSVYTPGFVVAGEEWRGWFSRQDLPVFEKSSPGRLQIDLQDGLARASFTPDSGVADGYTVHLARLGFEQATDVPAGENQGRTLEEDFVVLDWRSVHMEQGGQAWTAALMLPQPSTPASGRHALAAWVSVVDDPRPVQALGGWLE